VTSTPRPPRALLRHPAGWLASGFGGGYAPLAPGTVGSLIAIPPWLLLALWHPLAAWIGIALVFAVGVWASGWVIRQLGREDPGVVVIDEWAGQWLALSLIDLGLRLVPGLHVPSTWALLAIGFVAFRACDIAKPWPASWADQKVSGGLGAMLDDLFAGIWAGIAGIALLAAVNALSSSA
jgi:phosphatidylglycerophosphatase A